MGNTGWHAAPWAGVLTALRGEKQDPPPLGFLPDRGNRKQPNHRGLGAVWHLVAGEPEAKAIARQWYHAWVREQLERGLGACGGAVEVMMPDPHAAYELLPRLVFLVDAIREGPTGAAADLQQLWRWQIYAWRAGSTPDGQVVLPCTRLVTPLSQVTDACNRMLLDLPHRDNRWRSRPWDRWWSMFKDDPLSGMWAAEHFRRALEAFGVEALFGLESKPELEAPLLPWPMTIERDAEGHAASMAPTAQFKGIAPCWWIEVRYGPKERPGTGVTWFDRGRSPEEALEPARMAVAEKVA